MPLPPEPHWYDFSSYYRWSPNTVELILAAAKLIWQIFFLAAALCCMTARRR